MPQLAAERAERRAGDSFGARAVEYDMFRCSKAGWADPGEPNRRFWEFAASRPSWRAVPPHSFESGRLHKTFAIRARIAFSRLE
jgi:hypothetical protein